MANNMAQSIQNNIKSYKEKLNLKFNITVYYHYSLKLIFWKLSIYPDESNEWLFLFMTILKNL